MTRSIALIAAAALLGAASPPVRYTDVTAATQIDFHLENSPTSLKYLPETMGGGVALLDYDNDGRLDIFFVNGAKIDDPMPKGRLPDKSERKYWNRMYRQNADGTFTDTTEKAGLTGQAQAKYGMGVASADYNNDGFADLYVTNYGANTLYKNNGDGTFLDVTAAAGVQASGWSTSVGFFDYDNDGDLDLFVCRYLKWSFEMDRYCGDKSPGGRAYCHPDNFEPITNILYRNNGDGSFTDVSQAAGIAHPEGKSLGLAFADYDNDGWMDIYVANDSVQCFLFHNNGDGTFKETSLLAGVGFNEDGMTFAGMGVDFSDYNNDGRPDIIVTDLSHQRYMLFQNNGDGIFAEVTNPSGLGRETLAYSGWSTRFIDYDNDGWKDLFVAQGHVMDNIEKTNPQVKYLQPPLLLRNDKGRFLRADGGAPFQSPWAGRGAVFGDIDNDGDLDIVVTNVGQKAYVLRNDGGNANGWIRITAHGTKANKDGIGCHVKVTGASGLVQDYIITTTAGYLSASDKRLIVGLGGDKTAKTVEITWPGGMKQKFEGVASGTNLDVTQPGR
jgi:enediyne biosynthesis protein E4